MLNCSVKTAWFLGHRIRLVMDSGTDARLGGEGKTVEADETALSNSRKTKFCGARRAPHTKVLSLVERDGPIRSLTIDHRAIGPRFWKYLHPDSRLVTDKAAHFKFRVRNHESVDHSKYERARGDAHVNTLEGFFSVFKRGIIGVYQHVNAKHFDR
jgi:hypothetical protein